MKVRTIVVAALALAAMTACSNGKSSNAGASAQPSGGAAPAAGATPNCNGESPVWAISGPKIYLVPGDRMYGKTKQGAYMCLSQAQAEGYRHGRRPFRHHRHRRENAFST